MDVFFSTGINYLDQYNLGLQRKRFAVRSNLIELMLHFFEQIVKFTMILCYNNAANNTTRLVITTKSIYNWPTVKNSC